MSDSNHIDAGPNVQLGVREFNGTNLTVAGNTIKGFDIGIGYRAGDAQNSFATNQLIANNNVSQCRIGILGRTGNEHCITGNAIRRCIHPVVDTTHGNGSATTRSSATSGERPSTISWWSSRRVRPRLALRRP